MNNKEVQKNMVKYISTFDESIRDFNVEESQSDGEENTDNKYLIDTLK